MRFRLKFAAIFFTLFACKGVDIGSDTLTVAPGDASLKIAVNYMGTVACIRYMVRMNHSDEHRRDVLAKNRDLKSHLLNGSDGELISAEFKEARRKQGRQSWQHLRFSGDKFFGKSANNKLAMEKIASYCRRLLLSVDSSDKPKIKFISGFAVANQREKFTQDFVSARKEFGELHCEGDFCTFAKINGGKRYFVYIEPGKDEKIKAQVTYEGKTKTITVGGLYYEDPSRYRDGKVEIEPADEINLNTRVAQLKGEVSCKSDGGGNECSKPDCPLQCTVEVKRGSDYDVIKDTFTLEHGVSFDICNANSDFCNQRLEDAYQSSDKLYLTCRIEYKTDTCDFGLTMMNMIYGLKANRTCLIINRTQGKLRTVTCDTTDFRYKAELTISPR